MITASHVPGEAAALISDHPNVSSVRSYVGVISSNRHILHGGVRCPGRDPQSWSLYRGESSASNTRAGICGMGGSNRENYSTTQDLMSCSLNPSTTDSSHFTRLLLSLAEASPLIPIISFPSRRWTNVWVNSLSFSSPVGVELLWNGALSSVLWSP